MSLIEMCRRVLAETGWPVPSAITSNSDGTAQQIFAIANTELRVLSQKYDWPQLEVELSFDTVVDQEEYPWPADFRKLEFASVFDTEEYYRIRGSLNIQQWNRYKHGLLGSVSHQRFRQKYVDGDPTMELTPAPNDVRTYVALYYTNHYARDSDGVSIVEYVNDSDVSKIPEDLVELGVKWRFRRAKGLDFSAELAEYNAEVKSRFAGYKALGEIAVGGPSFSQDCLTEGYVPDNGFG